ncbi:MAG: hypothetical protein L0219_20070, partial [Phycisphaerales bacterium]|nr:hypothetical protein [Phycisphaerales bacterium]
GHALNRVMVAAVGQQENDVGLFRHDAIWSIVAKRLRAATRPGEKYAAAVAIMQRLRREKHD